MVSVTTSLIAHLAISEIRQSSLYASANEVHRPIKPPALFVAQASFIRAAVDAKEKINRSANANWAQNETTPNNGDIDLGEIFIRIK
jgi:hypothetical protein